ncbi:hypothetical protein B0J14DRAFT_661685 [Halenospora varia]|nr:hypothetical protein B0J14DRAFT_661685 [Halenospora varia]
MDQWGNIHYDGCYSGCRHLVVYHGMKLHDLCNLCRHHGLEETGTKLHMIERLVAWDAKKRPIWVEHNDDSDPNGEKHSKQLCDLRDWELHKTQNINLSRVEEFEQRAEELRSRAANLDKKTRENREPRKQARFNAKARYKSASAQLHTWITRLKNQKASGAPNKKAKKSKSTAKVTNNEDPVEDDTENVEKECAESEKEPADQKIRIEDVEKSTISDTPIRPGLKHRNYIMVSAIYHTVILEGINELSQMVTDFRVSSVSVDVEGYYVVFEEGVDIYIEAVRCFLALQGKEFFGVRLQLELHVRDGVILVERAP